MQLLLQSLTVALSIRQRTRPRDGVVGDGTPAHTDHMLKQSTRERTRLKNRHRHRARGLPHHGDVPRVSAERADIAPNPL